MAIAAHRDALRHAGTLVLLVRLLDQRSRSAQPADALALSELGILGQVAAGTDTPSRLARQLFLDPARVTHLVDRLVRLGYLERSLDEEDRRCWRLHLTASGEARLQSGKEAVRVRITELFTGLTEDEQHGLYLGLEGVRRLLSAPSTAARGTATAPTNSRE